MEAHGAPCVVPAPLYEYFILAGEAKLTDLESETTLLQAVHMLTETQRQLLRGIIETFDPTRETASSWAHRSGPSILRREKERAPQVVTDAPKVARVTELLLRCPLLLPGAGEAGRGGVEWDAHSLRVPIKARLAPQGLKLSLALVEAFMQVAPPAAAMDSPTQGRREVGKRPRLVSALERLLAPVGATGERRKGEGSAVGAVLPAVVPYLETLSPGQGGNAARVREQRARLRHLLGEVQGTLTAQERLLLREIDICILAAGGAQREDLTVAEDASDVVDGAIDMGFGVTSRVDELWEEHLSLVAPPVLSRGEIKAKTQPALTLTPTPTLTLTLTLTLKAYQAETLSQELFASIRSDEALYALEVGIEMV